MPPLRGSNAPRLCDRPMRPMRPTGRCHHQSSITCLLLLTRTLDPPAPGGFFVPLRSTQGRAPSLCSLCSLRIDGAAHLSSLEPWRLSRGAKREGDSRAREREAVEFLSRRRRVLKNSNPRGFAKIQRRIRGELGGIRTPARPSAATSKTSIFHTGPCIFGCISRCFLYRPPPPPRFQAKATRPKRHLTHASSLIVCEVSFLWVFWHIRGAGVMRVWESVRK